MSEQKTFYKVLLNGESMNGGDLAWSLPKQRKNGTWTPGKWHRVEGKIDVCNNGLHLTTEPYRWYKWGADVYEAEGRGDSSMRAGDDKTAFREARLLRLVERPAWLQNAYDFVDSIKDVRWFQQHESPRPEWRLFLADNLAAARAAAGAAARAAAWDASLLVQMHITSDLQVSAKHRQHALARWEVWTRGYGLLCDVDGVLYVYGGNK